jgi:hypothetical protein
MELLNSCQTPRNLCDAEEVSCFEQISTSSKCEGFFESFASESLQ